MANAAKTWVLYVELYSDPEHKNLSGVVIEGTFSGTGLGRTKARKVAKEKAQHAATKTGGKFAEHGEDNNYSREYRAWYKDPASAFASDLHPVYVAKLVAHNTVKLYT